jgi:DNA-binding NtrC family response regulator
VKVNCAALPESLLESELFGHEKGAFTGATNKRVGFFEEADGGTVFLDEIAEMSPLLQAKLLRVLQERTIHRVGSTQELSIDVRVICATNKDLEAAVAKGDFREDLYYRINVVRITLPPLRDRREDIPLLAEELLRRSARRVGVPPKAFTPEALAFLQAMELPGNVRELQNRVERSLIFSRGTVITVDDLQAETVPVTDMQAAAAYRPEPAEPAPSQAAAVQAAPPAAPGAEPALPAGASLEEIEQETIRRVLQTNRGNMQQSAKQLKISRSTLYSKVKKYNLEGVGRSS